MPGKTITQVPASLDCIDRLTLNVVKTGIECLVTYKLFDSAGAQIGHHKVVSMTLTQEQRDALTNFLKKGVVDAVNAAEGT